MNITKTLKNAGFDMIQSPVRNQKILQIWEKRNFMDGAQLYYTEIGHAFKSPVQLTFNEDPALSIDSNSFDEFGFNIGVSVLDDILESIGLGNFDLLAQIKNGKTVKISYDNSFSQVVPTGDLINYFSSADFIHPNPVLLRAANKNNLLVISGIVYAKSLIIEIESDNSFEADLDMKINMVADGKLIANRQAQNKIRMVSENINPFPVAVKANRIDFDRGIFNGLKLITDTNNLF